MTDETRKQFLEALRETCSIVAAARKTELQRQTIYLWMSKDKTFAKEVDEIIKDRARYAVDTLYTRAMALLQSSGPVNAQAGARCLELWMRNQGMLVEKHEVDIGKVEISFSPEENADTDKV